MKRKLLVLPLIALAMPLLAGCSNGPERQDNTLMVCVYDGGYGTEWIKQVATDYETKTGVHVEWEADQSILDRITSDLESPTYDVYMSHDISWQSFAAQGLLEPLDDLYEKEVEGTGKTLKERCVAGAADISKFNDHYYKVCYTAGAGGLVYNVDMFEDNGWAVPTTYAELKTLCQTIYDADITVGLDRVVPIAWSADREYYFDYLVFEWWAQLGGEDAINTYKAFKGHDGKNATGYEVYDPEGYHKEFMQAYSMWYDLFAPEANHKYFNLEPQNAKLVTANSLFANGKAAMIPYAQWAKWEIQNNSGIKFDFDVAMMKTPRANEEVTKDYNYNVGFGDSIIVPSNIPDESKALAKDFIAYLAGKEACKTFVDKANGAFLAFDYSDVDLGDLMKDPYVKSVHAKLTECTQINLVSNNPVAYVNSAAIMPWINNNYYYSKAFAFPDNEDYKPAKVGQTVYDAAKAGWSSWLQKAGVKD